MALMLLSLDQLHAATVVHLRWDPNSESDLSGYRVRYGIAPGTPTGPTIPVQIRMGNILTTDKVTIAVSN